jgi:hypothetical protein
VVGRPYESYGSSGWCGKVAGSSLAAGGWEDNQIRIETGCGKLMD